MLPAPAVLPVLRLRPSRAILTHSRLLAVPTAPSSAVLACGAPCAFAVGALRMPRPCHSLTLAQSLRRRGLRARHSPCEFAVAMRVSSSGRVPARPTDCVPARPSTRLPACAFIGRVCVLGIRPPCSRSVCCACAGLPNNVAVAGLLPSAWGLPTIRSLASTPTRFHTHPPPILFILPYVQTPESTLISCSTLRLIPNISHRLSRSTLR